jgi:uncharacterized protein (TIGR02246 family)
VQPSGADEAAILQLHRDFGVAWSKGDSSALLAFFAPDAVRVGAAGDIQRGPAEIRAAYERLLGGPFAGASVAIDPGSVRFLGADLALWQASMEIQPASPDRPSLRGYVVEVMKRIDGRWLILETHPKLFPLPPPASS